jgi:hypothetical protein
MKTIFEPIKFYQNSYESLIHHITPSTWTKYTLYQSFLSVCQKRFDKLAQSAFYTNIFYLIKQILCIFY